MYAHRQDGESVLETVDEPGFVGYSASLALDGTGSPHIAAFRLDNGQLRYARREAGVWLVETVDSNNNIGTTPSLVAVLGRAVSLAVTEEGLPRIAYLDDNRGRLKYAELGEAGWWAETVDSRPEVGYDPSLALDAGGRPHISYGDFRDGDLEYVTRVGGRWSSETVDSDGWVGLGSSIALDAEDTPHITYREFTLSVRSRPVEVRLSGPARLAPRDRRRRLPSRVVQLAGPRRRSGAPHRVLRRRQPEPALRRQAGGSPAVRAVPATVVPLGQPGVRCRDVAPCRRPCSPTGRR